MTTKSQADLQNTDTESITRAAHAQADQIREHIPQSAMVAFDRTMSTALELCLELAQGEAMEEIREAAGVADLLNLAMSKLGTIH